MKNRVFMIYNNNHTVQIRHIVPLQLQTIFFPLLFVFISELENNSFECKKNRSFKIQIEICHSSVCVWFNVQSAHD